MRSQPALLEQPGADSPGTTVDVGVLIDDSPVSNLQIRVLVLCGLVAILDGIDTFSIGAAGRSIAQALSFPLPSLANVFSIALLGAALGAFAFGPLADRFGRKPMLVLAVAIFSVFTYATALAWSYESLLTIRFFSGVGLGGATPCFLAMGSDYAPRRIRAAVTSALWAGFPLGGMIGSFLSSYLLAHYGWPSLFYVGGVAPFAVIVLILALVPESVRFLIASGAVRERIFGVMRRLAPSREFSAETRFVVQEVHVEGVPARQLFTNGRGVATPLLWVPFFMSFGVLVIVVLWTPALLGQAGMSAPDAATVVAYHGLGGFIGMAAAGKLLERFGSIILVPALLLGAVCTFFLGMVGTSVPLASLVDALIGVFVGIGASGVIGFASTVYPTAMRSSGIGWGMAMGRLGQVAAPLIVGAMLTAGWKVGDMFLAIAAGPVIAAVFVPLATQAFKRTTTT